MAEGKDVTHSETKREDHHKHVALVSMDGSEHSDYAFHWYMEHIHKPEHYVILLHVPERHSFIAGPLGGSADVESIQAMMAEEDQKEKGFLELLGKKMKDEGIGGKVKSVAGKPGEVVCHVADEEQASFIVCGTRGHGRLRRTFMGSVSDYILHHAHVPVFVCRHKDSHKHITGHH